MSAPRDLDTITHAAAVALLWSETIPVVYTSDEHGRILSTREWNYGPDGTEPTDFAPADDFYSVSDIDEQSMAALRSDCADFLLIAGGMLDEWDDEQIGHDFILTRNGHGAGFWDRGKAHGDELTKLCKPYGEVHVFGGNADGSISIEG